MIRKISSLSIVIPVYNDQEVLNELYGRLKPVIESFADNYEILLVDDGSEDDSWHLIARLNEKDGHVLGIKLMRNFGQQNAIAAGLEYVSGDIVVIMDSDLQDRPEDIPKLVESLLLNDVSMAIAEWEIRKDGFLKRFLSKAFYFFSQKITKINHSPNLGVFRAIRKEVVTEFKKYEEKTASTLSLLYWIGFDYVAVKLERDARYAGNSGYSIKKMMGLTLDRILSFSMLPIRIVVFSGLIISLISFAFGMLLIIRRIFGHVAPGWTSIIVLILFLFGLNFLFIGIIGEYLGRVFLESKRRPKFIIKKILK